MSVELGLLRLFADDRDVQATHHGYIETVENLEREVRLLFNLLDSYYKEYDDRESCPKEDMLAYYDLKYPKSRGRDLHLDLISQVYTLSINHDLMKAYLDQLLERHKAVICINKLMPVMEGEKYGILDTIRDDIDEYIDLLHNPPDRLSVPVPCTLTVKELVQQEILEEGLPWHIPEVTEAIGGIRRKTLGLLYAYVDSGKTSFSMASCANFARQLAGTERRICYCGNEESATRLRLRLVQSILNWNRHDIREKEDEATEKAQEYGLDNVLLFEDITTSAQLEYIIKNYKPEILYIDQSTDVDVKLGRKREGVDYLKALFKWYRSLATKNDMAIIGVAQGVGDAENTKYLKLSDIFGSRVAIQGALDWALGIGRLVDDPVDESQRYININKNKLHDGDSSKFACMFDKYTNTWRSI